MDNERVVSMLKVNELFTGIGAFRKALINLGIEHEIVGISEIDKCAIKSYVAMYGAVRNYGDISNVERFDYADLWTYGFPCQDISVAGNQAGIVAGKTRSGLLYEVERLLEIAIAEGNAPKYLIMENVKNLVGKKFMPDFQRWLDKLDELGYRNYWKVLNSKDYSVPQNRERVFCVSIRKDLKMDFEFNKPVDLKLKLRDVLQSDEEVDKNFYVPIQLLKRTNTDDKSNVCGPKCVLAGILTGDGWEYCMETSCRVYDENGISPTVTTVSGGRTEKKVLIHPQKINGVEKIRKLTPKEYWKLQGFSDEDFAKAATVNSNNQLYKQAGNSITVTVLESILKRLLEGDEGT